MSFGKVVGDVRVQRGCTCWDCLRAQGITPPLFLRDKHPVKYPRIVFGTDVDGVPRQTQQKKSKDKATHDERKHLWEAVRNREAI